MILSVHQPQYIPWLGYFDKIEKSDCFVFLDKVQYKAREFQNRNKIRTKDGWIWLTVPVVTKGLREQKICDVQIDNTSDWARRHIRSLNSWYSNTECYKDHIPFFEYVYSREWKGLSELNVYIINYMLKELNIKTPIYFESELGTTSQSTDRIVEICGKLKADKYLSGVGGRDYLEEGKFEEAGIELLYQDFKHPVYKQRDMKDKESFIPYMSAIDLMFNEGKKAREILQGG